MKPFIHPATQNATRKVSRAPRTLLCLAAVCAGHGLFHESLAAANTLTWDAGGATPTAPTDGSGTWDTTTNADWSNGSNDALWNADATGSLDTAVFGSNNGAAGTVTLGSAISAGSISFLAPGSGSYIVGNSTSQLTLTSGEVSVATGVSATLTAPIAGSNGLTVSGGGTLSLGGLGTTSPVAYTGDTTVNNSTLQFNNLSTSTAITLGNGTSNLNLQGSNPTLTSRISQSKQFYLNANIVIASGADATINFSPRTYIGEGSSVSTPTAVSGSTTSTLNLVADTTLDRDLFYDSAGSFNGTLNVQAASISSSPIVFEGVNGSYSSSSTGYFSGTPGTFNVNGELATANPTLGGTYTLGAFGGASTGIIDTPISGGTATWSTGALGLSTTYAGVINGNNALAITGGTLSLTGNNSYAGGTAVTGGVLAVNNSSGSGLGTGSVNVGSLGTLAGTGAFSGALTNAGTISPGTGGTAGILTASGGSTLSTGSTLAFTLVAPNVAGGTNGNSLLVATGGLTLNQTLTLYLVQGSSISDGTYHLIDYSVGSVTDNSSAFSGWTVVGAPAGDSYVFSNDTSPGDNGLDSIDVTFSSSSVPEPASIGFLALSGLLLARRRRQMRSHEGVATSR